VDFNETIKRLQSAQGDPEKLTLATVDVVLIPHAPELRTALEVAAVPHWFDAKILSTLLETDEASASKLLKDLCSLPMVESFPIREGWNVHEATRLALRNRLAKEEPERLAELSARAAQYFSGSDPAARVEAIYHRLLAAPEKAAGELEQLWKEWDFGGRDQQLQALGVVLDELIRTDLLVPRARARSLVCLGWIKRGWLSLQKTQDMATEASILFRDLREPAGEADARDQLGDVYLAQGRLELAMNEFSATRQIAKSFTESEPQNTYWWRELSVCLAKAGRVLEGQGKPVEALREYETGKKILLQLTEQNPQNTDWQGDLSTSYNCIGNVLADQGKLDEALREYEVFKQIMVELTERDPANTDWLRSLSVAHCCIGLTLQGLDKYAEAQSEYEVVKQIRLSLTKRDQQNTEWQRDLANAHNFIGSLFRNLGKYPEAQGEYEAAKQIRLWLTEHESENTEWQRDLSLLHINLGYLHETQNQLGEALREYEAGLAISGRLSIHDPTNALWQQDLSFVREAVDRVRKRLQEPDVKELELEN
jgi:tetratricopeptide (TPR) repeat protein